MKKYYKLMIYCAIICCSLNAYGQKNDNWRLVWSDEFNYVGPPDPAKWDFEGATHRSHEAQIYTNRSKNVYVKDGYLTITGLKEEYKNVRYIPNNHDWDRSDPNMHYTSASITTKNKASWKYGKIEVRAKVPAGAGTWPAIWMLGMDKENYGWPREGEIDIMESYGKMPNVTTATIHYAAPYTNTPVSTGNHYLPVARPVSDNFHIYTAIWDSTKITILFDNKPFLIYDYPNTNIVFNQHPFYLILNLALGGDGGGPIDNKIFPAKFMVDYVRVYQAP